MTPTKRLTDADFKWIPSESHDADSTEFRARQLARIAAAQQERDRERAGIRTIGTAKRKA